MNMVFYIILIRVWLWFADLRRIKVYIFQFLSCLTRVSLPWNTLNILSLNAWQMMRILKGNAVWCICRQIYFCVSLVFVQMRWRCHFLKHIVQHYTAHLWCNYRASSLQELQVAYNDAMRILLRIPRWHNASEMFVSARVITFKAVTKSYV